MNLVLCFLLLPFIFLYSVLAKEDVSFTEKLSLNQIISLIRQDCGEICDTTIEGQPGKYYDKITKDFDCEILFSSPVLEYSLPNGAKPPMAHNIPKDVLDEFLYHGKIDRMDKYRDDSGGSTHVLKWSNDLIDLLKKQARSGTMHGAYGPKAVKELDEHIKKFLHPDHLGRVLVIGSQSPWLEVLLLENGAKEVVTLDYVKIKSDHVNIETMTNTELNKEYLAKGQDFELFDSVVTFSSLEHSGLGRYGDGINPWGDLIMSAKARCLTKPGGRMLIGIPVGFDGLLFNSCRMYGPLMLSHLFANWDQVYTEAKMFPNGSSTPIEEWFSSYRSAHVKCNTFDYLAFFNFL